MALTERLYYDDQVIVEKQRDYVWIVSPSNHKWFRVKKYFYPLIRQIFDDKGYIYYNNIKDTFQKESHDPLSISNLESVIEGLLRSGVFFKAKNDYLAAVRDFKKSAKERKLFQMVYLHLTVRCNYNCWYCYNAHLKKSKADELDTRQWFEIIDRFHQHNTGLFVFTGGEPLLRPDLAKILRKARDTGAHVHLLSNGSLFTENKIKTLLPLADQLILSLDSFNKVTQGKNRSSKGFENIIHLLEHFRDHPAERNKVSVRSVVTTENYMEIQEFRRTLKEKYNIENHIYLKFIPNSPDEIHLVPDDSLLGELLEPESLETVISGSTPRTPNFRNRCDASFESIAVNSKGEVYPCHQLLHMPEFRMFNMLEDRWYEKYRESPVKEQFARLDVDKLSKCKSCSLRYLCGGGCPALALKLYGSLHHMVEYQCSENQKVARARLVSSGITKLN